MRALGKRERPRARAAVIFRCIIFIFATSRIHKKHVQLGHADGCRGNKHSKQQPFACPRPRLMRIWYMKSFLGGPWLWGPKAVAYLCLMGKSAPGNMQRKKTTADVADICKDLQACNEYEQSKWGGGRFKNAPFILKLMITSPCAFLLFKYSTEDAYIKYRYKMLLNIS